MSIKSKILLGLSLVLSSCLTNQEQRSPKKGPPLQNIPYYFPPITYTYENNPYTEDGFELGKKLFFDPILSSDSTISCASCHKQALAFADSPHHRVSVGVNDSLGTRNAPPLTNLIFYPSFMIDGGIHHLDLVPINAITSKFEMNESMSRVILKLQRNKKYPFLFKKAFNRDTITSPYLLYALSQYLGRLISSNSPYDAYLLGNQNALSENQKMGMQLFQTHCSMCHQGPLFSNFSFRNNGLDTIFKDEGRQRITELVSDRGKFRVPSLRNIAVTAPYMHDGRFFSLEEVLLHYRQGVKKSSTLDSILQTGGTLGIRITAEESKLIINFLHGLTDTLFLQNPKLGP